jgi:hypothetical protein
MTLSPLSGAVCETLWSRDTVTCSLEIREGRYEDRVQRAERLVCLLALDSERAARVFAQQCKLKRTS